MRLHEYRSVVLSAAVVAGLILVQLHDAGWLAFLAVPGAK